ncbi:MAG: beta-lactamase family protein [Planctomycetes bacterium]|nr:beta-lactamase family protein [Planctomycetota bacterium]
MEHRADPEGLGFSREGLRQIEARLRAHVDAGRLPGLRFLLTREGQTVQSLSLGQRDREARSPMAEDTLFRIYSMSKAITAAAVMTLVDQGRLALEDPISRYLPEFAGCRVWQDPECRPAVITMQHLLTHTAGLTYGFLHAHPVDAMYRAAGCDWGTPPGMDLKAAASLWARMPLLFYPGSAWNYSVSFDVLGRIVEVVSGMDFPAYLERHLFAPLGIEHTGFHVNRGAAQRLAALYTVPVGGGEPVRDGALGSYVLHAPECPSGGGGLVSTAVDYTRFLQMLLAGGEGNGTRILQKESVRAMTSNQLPAGTGLIGFGIPMSDHTDFRGRGYGFGGYVVTDPEATGAPANAGEFSGDGAASTFFWMDPATGITAVFLAQVLPSSFLPLRSDLRKWVRGALVNP